MRLLVTSSESDDGERITILRKGWRAKSTHERCFTGNVGDVDSDAQC